MPQETGNILVVKGQPIVPDSEGEYIVPHDMIRGGDLTKIPAGRKIKVSYAGIRGRTLEHAIMVSKIEVLSTGRVLAYADFFRCPCCWEHALSFKSYTEAVMQLFAHEESTSIYFSTRGMGSYDDLGPSHEIALEVDNGNFDDIEESVKNTVLRILKPVDDMREGFDTQYREVFGE